MDIRPGDVLSDSRSDWEVISPPFCTRAGGIVYVRVRKVDQPDWTNLLTEPEQRHYALARLTLTLSWAPCPSSAGTPTV